MSQYIVVFLLVVFVGSIGTFAKANEKVSLNEERPASPPLSAVALLECYSCVSCLKVGKETSKKVCPYTSDPFKVKKCVKYSEVYPLTKNGKNISTVIRGCASERGSCEDIKRYSNTSPYQVQLENCTECEGDNCNSVSRSLPGLFLAFFAVVLTPIFAKHILS